MTSDTRFWHPFSAMGRVNGNELVIVRGEGCRIWDDQGGEYLDGTGGLWFCSVGHGRKEIADAAAAQLTTLAAHHRFGDEANPPVLELSERVVALSPLPDGAIFYGSGGSDAVDSAGKIARRYWSLLGQPEKTVIVSRANAYHGMNAYGTSLAGIAANREGFGTLIGDTAQIAWDDPAELETLIAANPGRIAAFIGEPVIGAGGVVPPPDGYWPEIARICRDHDVLFIQDEVICGFGRLGTPFGCQKYGFTPDIMTVSKQITSSYMPLAAVIVSEAVYQAIADNSARLNSFGHGFTASGHPVATAVGLENLAIIEERDLMGNAARLEAAFQAGLRSFADHRLVGEARGTGLIGALELVADKASKRPFDPIGRVGAVANRIGHEEGLIFRAIGDQLALCPPLIVTEDDIAEIMARLGRTLDRLPAALAAEGIA